MSSVKQYDLNTIGGRIGWSVQQSGKTLTQLGAEVGCTHSAISQWISGSTDKISAQLLQAFADACGVELRWVITGQLPVRSRYIITGEMQRISEAISLLARESPLEVDTVVRMVEAAASRHHQRTP